MEHIIQLSFAHDGQDYADDEAEDATSDATELVFWEGFEEEVNLGDHVVGDGVVGENFEGENFVGAGGWDDEDGLQEGWGLGADVQGWGGDGAAQGEVWPDAEVEVMDDVIDGDAADADQDGGGFEAEAEVVEAEAEVEVEAEVVEIEGGGGVVAIAADAAEAVPTITWALCEGWAAGGVGVVNLDVVPAIIMNLLPSMFEMPPSPAWAPWPPSEAGWIVSAMRVSRAWYGCITHMRGLWGAVLAISHPPPRRPQAPPTAWRRVQALSLDAPKRLLYADPRWHASLDAVLDNASAVYAQADCPWEHFGLKLGGREMPFLEVLWVVPNDHEAPDGVLEMPAGPLIAPRCIVFECSSPLVVLARRLLRFVVSHFSVGQLREALRVAPFLTHVEIHKTYSTGRIDWTALLSAGSWLHLEVLIFWCGALQSFRLASDSITLDTPQLRTLDAGGAVLVRGQRVRSVHFENIWKPDLLRILQNMPATAFLSVRTLSSVGWGGSEWRAGRTIGWLELHELMTLRLSRARAEDTLSLLQCFSMPSLYELSLGFDATGPPNHEALEDVVGLLECALGLGVEKLREAFRWSKFAFEKSGYLQLLDPLNELFTEELDGTVNLVDGAHTLGALKNAALSLIEYVQAMGAHIDRYPGEVLREIVDAALRAMSMNLVGADCVLTVAEEYGELLYSAVLEEANGDVRSINLSVTGASVSRDLSTAGAPESWGRHNSLAYAGAHTLYALSVLPIVEVIVSEGATDPFHCRDRRSRREVEDLSSALMRLAGVDTMRFDISEKAQGTFLLEAIGGDVLPMLTDVHVTSQAVPGYWVAGMHPAHMPSWFNALETMLRRRAERGRPVRMLEIKGYFCICSVWARRVRRLVGALNLDVACARRIKGVCLLRDRPPVWW